MESTVCVENATNAVSLAVDLQGSTDDNEVVNKLSKNQLRKQRFHERKLAARRASRADERARHRLAVAQRLAALAEAGTPAPPKRERRQQELQRLRQSLEVGLNVCVDLQFAHSALSDKQRSRLSQQLTRLYGANKAAARPVHLHLTSLPVDSDFYRLCCRKTAGFSEFLLDRSDLPPERLFEPRRLIYLSPDADEELAGHLSPDDVYVIGGIVDETLQPGLSARTAAAAGIRTRRLPVGSLLTADGRTGRSCVLTVNQAFEVLLKVWNSPGDWTEALLAAVPARKGFVPRQ